jgi:hypothetical protein
MPHLLLLSSPPPPQRRGCRRAWRSLPIGFLAPPNENGLRSLAVLLLLVDVFFLLLFVDASTKRGGQSPDPIAKKVS